MKQILIVSDSHYHNGNFLNIIHHYPTIDTIFHAGDIQDTLPQLPNHTFKIVRGNNDFADLPPMELIEIEKVPIMLCHGHQYLVDFGPSDIAKVARDNHCKLVVHGHTHMPFFKKVEDVYVLNPGSVSFPRSPDHPYPTFAILTIDQDKIDAKFYHAKTFEEIPLEKQKKKKRFGFSFFKGH